MAGYAGRQPWHEPEYDGPPRFVGAPRKYVPQDDLSSYPYAPPSFQLGRGEGSTGPMPRADSGPMPRVGTGPMPRADSGPEMPRGGDGSDAAGGFWSDAAGGDGSDAAGGFWSDAAGGDGSDAAGGCRARDRALSAMPPRRSRGADPAHPTSRDVPPGRPGGDEWR